MAEESNEVKIARIDERTLHILNKVDNLNTHYVTKDEFRPVKAISFGLVAIMCVTVIGSLLALVLR